MPQGSTPSTSLSSSLPVRTAAGSRTDRQKVPADDIIYAVVNYEDDYVQPIILDALRSLISAHRLRLIPPLTPGTPDLDLDGLVPPGARLLQIRAYEALDFDRALARGGLVNSYVIRKALVRKHFLSATVDYWVAKHPTSVLGSHVRRAEAFEVDYAEFLDDALVEAWDLRASLERNEGCGCIVDGEDAPGDMDDGDRDGCATIETQVRGDTGAEAQGCVRRDRSDNGAAAAQRGGGGGATTTTGARDPSERDWWILKPSMSDRGQGIRLFSTMEELQGIFDGWEADEPPSDSDEDEDEEDDSDDNDNDKGGKEEEKDFITTSHLRHFVAQPYIHPPLLLPGCGSRKFHIRAYVLCAGAMRVYVCREMLALFAAKPYSPPWERRRGGTAAASPAADADDDDEDDYLSAHLTNTCLQGGPGAAADGSSVRRFWDLPDLAGDAKEAIFAQVRAVAGEVFEAAARGMVVHFQPLPCAFEAYGLDFLVDGTAGRKVWLLEVNAFPDFRQTGEGALREAVVAEFWRGAVRWGVGPWAGIPGPGGNGDGEGERGGEEIWGDETMVLVRDLDLGRR